MNNEKFNNVIVYNLQNKLLLQVSQTNNLFCKL